MEVFHDTELIDRSAFSFNTKSEASHILRLSNPNSFRNFDSSSSISVKNCMFSSLFFPKYDYDENEILAMLTAHPAEILGKGDCFGRLEWGLVANFLVAEGIPDNGYFGP